MFSPLLSFCSKTKAKKRSKKRCMGNPENPPDSRDKIRKKVPKGVKAIGHHVAVEYFSSDDNSQTEWCKGRVIMYNGTKGYLIRFDDYGPESDAWEKNIGGDDVKFLD